MAGDKKTRLVEPERCLSVTVVAATPPRHRSVWQASHNRVAGHALVAEAYGKQAAQGGCDALVTEAYASKPHRAAATPSSQKRMASKPHRGDEASRPRGTKKSSSIRLDGAAQKSSIEASVVSARRGPAAIREQAQPSSRQRQQRKRARLGHDRDRE